MSRKITRQSERSKSIPKTEDEGLRTKDINNVNPGATVAGMTHSSRLPSPVTPTTHPFVYTLTSLPGGLEDRLEGLEDSRLVVLSPTWIFTGISKGLKLEDPIVSFYSFHKQRVVRLCFP